MLLVLARSSGACASNCAIRRSYFRLTWPSFMLNSYENREFAVDQWLERNSRRWYNSWFFHYRFTRKDDEHRSCLFEWIAEEKSAQFKLCDSELLILARLRLKQGQRNNWGLLSKQSSELTRAKPSHEPLSLPIWESIPQICMLSHSKAGRPTRWNPRSLEVRQHHSSLAD